MGLTHATFLRKLERNVGVSIDQAWREKYPTTFGDAFQFLRQLRDSSRREYQAPLAGMNDDILWRHVVDAARFALHASQVSIAPETQIAKLFKY